MGLHKPGATAPRAAKPPRVRRHRQSAPPVITASQSPRLIRSRAAAKARPLDVHAVETVNLGPVMPSTSASHAEGHPISITGKLKPSGRLPVRAWWATAASPWSTPEVLVPSTTPMRCGPWASSSAWISPRISSTAARRSPWVREGAAASWPTTRPTRTGPAGTQPSSRAMPEVSPRNRPGATAALPRPRAFTRPRAERKRGGAATVIPPGYGSARAGAATDFRGSRACRGACPPRGWRSIQACPCAAGCAGRPPPPGWSGDP